jgi:hypothetical protein
VSTTSTPAPTSQLAIFSRPDLDACSFEDDETVVVTCKDTGGSSTSSPDVKCEDARTAVPSVSNEKAEAWMQALHCKISVDYLQGSVYLAMFEKVVAGTIFAGISERIYVDSMYRRGAGP